MEETSAIETRNTGGLSGFITGLGNLIKTAAPVAADIYSLKAQGQILKNQSANDLARLKMEQEMLQQQANGMSVSAGGPMPPWFKWAGIAVGALVLVLVVMRLKK